MLVGRTALTSHKGSGPVCSARFLLLCEEKKSLAVLAQPEAMACDDVGVKHPW